MSDQFVAEIRIFAGNFPPTGWAFCNGQLMPISQNTALFSLLGTTYGGDGKSTFALPDLQGMAPMQPGQGAGLSLRDLGETSGASSITLLESEMPVHSHVLSANAVDPGDRATPGTDTVFAPSSGGKIYQSTSNTTLHPLALTLAGGSLPHNNMQPYLTLNFIIALQGIFPQRP
ncbi:phage tail protein [Nocardioides stalactiti]|uniref:phage tail protein n=1 Tax=Nocardioides stalactiti TaxID=2755356 RepID=UPI0016030B2B|nr:tail fiber protein [Nocardioides stalactiti]